MKTRIMFLIVLSLTYLNFLDAQTPGRIPKYKTTTTFNNSNISQSLSGNTTGFIGINTIPLHQLQVKGNISLEGTSSTLIFGQSHTPSANWGEFAIEYNVAAGGLNFWKPFGSNNFGNYFLFISDHGNVCINKSTQVNTNYKLDVNGKARADEVVVNTDGSDFVFEPGYSLMNLEKLEKCIQENKHLPGIASAIDMKINGMALGEMNTLLLQKIEELTLYIIDLKKRIENLEKK